MAESLNQSHPSDATEDEHFFSCLQIRHWPQATRLTKRLNQGPALEAAEDEHSPHFFNPPMAEGHTISIFISDFLWPYNKSLSREHGRKASAGKPKPGASPARGLRKQAP